MSTIGERIRKVRDAKGYTQGYVAGHLNVVHTTVGDYERHGDLKLSQATKLAAVLEIDKKLLTDDASDLDADDVVPVVRRESLRLFLEETSLERSERRKFERIVDHTLAPKTVAGWHELRDLIQQFLGHPPDRRSLATSNDNTASAVAGGDAKKRMARVGVDQISRALRRVG